MQIPAIIFQAFQVGVGGLMTIGFRRWIRSEEEKEEAEKEEAEKEEAEKEEAEKGEATDAQQGK
jgi:sodium/bile acid cotransporter 7